METRFQEGRLGNRLFSALDIKTGLLVVLAAVVVVTIFTAMAPSAFNVLSNSTGTWCPGSGASRCTGLTAPFSLSSIVVPIIIVVGLILYFLRNAN